MAHHSLRFAIGLVFGAVCTSSLGLSGCESRPTSPGVQTTIRSLNPVAVRPAPPKAFRQKASGVVEFCQGVERATRANAEGMPARLDEDTIALGARAHGCDIVLTYGLVTLEAAEVTTTGLQAMRDQVVQQLCSEAEARKVMEHRGSFTSVYEDRSGRVIGRFSVSLGDCMAASAGKFFTPHG